MSELFSWLEEADLQSKRVTTEADVHSANIVDAEQNIDWHKSESPPSAPQESKFAGHERVSPAPFDLKMADWRIRTALDHGTLVGEQYRILRAKLISLQRQRGIKTILVTSSIPTDGKTFTACCLSGILAQEPGKRVLLVDADMRKPSAAVNLGIDGKSGPGGLSLWLQGGGIQEGALRRCSNLDFYFLPSGPVPENCSELLSSPNLEIVIKGLAGIFDWVVIDCPPVLALADAMQLSSLCDTVLLVVRANKTPSKLVLQAIQMIGRDRIGGVVMNRVRLSSLPYYNYYPSYWGSPNAKK
jgi:capsular exopolysaccharide synthesis family protein